MRLYMHINAVCLMVLTLDCHGASSSILAFTVQSQYRPEFLLHGTMITRSRMATKATTKIRMRCSSSFSWTKKETPVGFGANSNCFLPGTSVYPWVERCSYRDYLLTELHAVTPRFEEVCETTGITLTRFMHEVERCNPELQELAQLFSGIQIASKAIHNLVKRSQLPGTCVLGLEGAVNVQGEDQKVSQSVTQSVSRN